MKKLILIITVVMAITLIFPLAYADSIPDWVKNTAGWWATDAISETEFVNAIEFLINVGIIQTESESKCVKDILKFFNDKQEITDVCEQHESNIIELIPYKNNLSFNSYGFRGVEFSNEKPSNVYRIFMVGGSTMLGAETTNDTTIPSILQKMFDEKNLDLKIEVINAGVAGGNTISELALIKSKIINYNPDLIIMFDGWNDLSADYAVENTINKWAQVCALGNEKNFDVVIALQPIAGFGNKSLTPQEKINSLTGEDHKGFQLIQSRSTYDWIARQMQILSFDAEIQLGKGICETYDLRSIFDGVNGAIYWDQGHILHAGNLILAEKFFELSMKKIDSSFVSEQKFTQIISDYNSIPILTYLLSEIGISDKTFQNELRNVIDMDNEKKGKFFQLKNEFGNISDSFVGKDLRNTNLSDFDFSGHDLTGINLSGYDLRDIDFRDTIIRGSDLSNTDLQGADMSGMDLRGINFSDANLRDVNFTDAIFSKIIQASGDCNDENPIVNVIKNFKCISVVVKNETIRTDFTNADLTNAKFGTKKTEGEQMLYFVNFTNADLTNVNLYSVQFFGNNFTDAKLNGISGDQIFILESDFTNSEIKNFRISNAWFQSSSFYNADMRNGNFDSITFIDLDFSETNFQGTEFTLLNEIGGNDYSCKNNVICD